MPYRFLLPLLLFCSLAAGCSSVRTVGRAGDARTTYADVDRAVRGKIARISFKDGASVAVMGLHVTADSLTWIDQRGNRLQSAQTANVREVSVVKAVRGALAGMVVGAVVGAGVGTARAYMQGDDPADDPLGLTTGQKLHTFPIAHALYGMLVATPVGAIIGARRTYRFEQPSVPPAVVTRR